jgi:hypothetical protein
MVKTPDYIIRTQPLDASQIIATQPDSVTTIRSARDSIMIVRTDRQDGSLRRIGDQELLALFPDQTVTLVRYSPSHAELIILDSR